MFLIIAGERDIPAAGQFASQFDSKGAVVMTPADLSLPGWRHDPIDPRRSQAAIGDLILAARDIEGAVTLLPFVTASDIPHIASNDRGYVAAEMTAFLWSFLTGLTCPLLNRPRAGCLSGPAWPPERWALLAAEVDVPVWPLRRPVEATQYRDQRLAEVARAFVTVVGSQCINDASDELGLHARRLAAAAETEMLTVMFAESTEGFAVAGVSAWPTVSDTRVGEAIRTYFSEQAA
jgi:hypothetical protein